MNGGDHCGKINGHKEGTEFWDISKYRILEEEIFSAKNTKWRVSELKDNPGYRSSGFMMGLHPDKPILN